MDLHASPSVSIDLYGSPWTSIEKIQKCAAPGSNELRCVFVCWGGIVAILLVGGDRGVGDGRSRRREVGRKGIGRMGDLQRDQEGGYTSCFRSVLL